MADTVAEVGAKVTGLRPGDEVFGWCGRSADGGGFAQYARARCSMVVPKPATLTFEQAASIPVSGVTALQAVRDWAQVRPGQKVLINGASGGVGTFAVQIAKALGAEVTGVCSTPNVELVRSIGADAVIDYTKEERPGASVHILCYTHGEASTLNENHTDLLRQREHEPSYLSPEATRTAWLSRGSMDPRLTW